MTNDGHKQKQLFQQSLFFSLSTSTAKPSGHRPLSPQLSSVAFPFSRFAGETSSYTLSLFSLSLPSRFSLRVCIYIYIVCMRARACALPRNRNEVVMKDPYGLACHKVCRGVWRGEKNVRSGKLKRCPSNFLFVRGEKLDGFCSSRRLLNFAVFLLRRLDGYCRPTRCSSAIIWWFITITTRFSFNWNIRYVIG